METGHLDRSFKMVWMLIGLCLLVVAIAFVLGSVATAFWAILVAALLVFILKNPVAWLQLKGIPRGLSTGVFLVVVLAALTVILVSLIPLMIDQGTQLLQAIPGYLSQIQNWWESISQADVTTEANPVITTITEQLFEILGSLPSLLEGNIVSGVFAAGASIANIFFVGFTAFLVAFWVLIDYDKMASEVHTIAGRTSEWYLVLFSTIFSRVVGGFIKGTLIGSLITGILAGICYWIVGIPFSGALGMIAGILSIIPYLGPFITTIVVAMVSIFISPIALIVGVLGSILIPWIISTFVSPKIMSSTVNLHPGITILSIIGGSALGGILGMVLAIPVMAVVKCIFIYFFEGITGRQLVSKAGAIFDGEPATEIDPVADATDGYLDEKTLLRIVELNEAKVKKIENLPKRSIFTLFHDLARPMQRQASDQKSTSDSNDSKDPKNSENSKDG